MRGAAENGGKRGFLEMDKKPQKIIFFKKNPKFT